MNGKRRLGDAWRLIGLLVVMTAPLAARAAEQPVKMAAASEADHDDLVCRTVDRPGSHMKQRVCATAAEWSAARGRLFSLKANPAVASLGGGDKTISTAATGFSFQR
jgi:hypothetical protein